MRDYYSLHGVFLSSVEPTELPLLVQPDRAAGPTPFERELGKRQAVVDDFLKARHAEMLPQFRARAAVYLVAASQGTGRRGDRREQTDLNRALLFRWRAFLADAREKHDPILAPLLAFAALPKADFAARARPLAERIVANSEPGKPINSLVAKAFAGKPPGSLQEVGERYEALFKDTDTAWQSLLRAAPKGAPTCLPTPEQEAIRQVLYGPNAPANIPLAQMARYLDRAQRNKLTPLQRRVEQWKANSPDAPPRAMVLQDNPSVVPARLLVRGNPNNPGAVVPRQFLEVLAGPQRKPFTRGSGRLELARAIASRDNPLTARVLVNRIWQHHFGAGLVPTPGDFGFRGDPPTHPELLDWLAWTFMEQGWSIKHLHRLIVLSAVYRQASDDNLQSAAIDPENTLLWRMNRQRLELEPLRDALLAVSGHLDDRMGGLAVDLTKRPYPPRRTVYGFIDRQNLPGLYRAFDLASPDTATLKRHTTTVPQQALFLMNGAFVLEQARAFATRPDVVSQKDDRARIDRMHRIAYGRPADAEEIELGLAFLRSAADGKTEPLSPWMQYAQVLLLANELAFVD
jgi:hypothetical protein